VGWQMLDATRIAFPRWLVNQLRGGIVETAQG
jgi:hypothetical protein